MLVDGSPFEISRRGRLEVLAEQLGGWMKLASGAQGTTLFITSAQAGRPATLSTRFQHSAAG
jgi:hypothetical protein